MKRLFNILPAEFFKPLTGKYKQEYADCILLIFNTFKPEISYGTNREIIVRHLINYFEADDDDMSFDEETYVSDARGKANGVIAMLKSCGWLEYEQDINHQINIVLQEYTIPIIEAMNKVIKDEETEYQGLISQIHASLQNQDLYAKPYELLIKGVLENTDRLLSELKKLNASIKRHMDKQTNDLKADEVLQLFFEYHQNIGSKAYLRMKTSENIAYFRSAIIERLEYIMEQPDVMQRAALGYMEVEECRDENKAFEEIQAILMDVKSSFYRLDDIIEEIEKKHTRYMRNAVLRAKFLLSTGNNQEGKLNKILNAISVELNSSEQGEIDCQELFDIYSQNYISPESLQIVAVTKKRGTIDKFSQVTQISETERQLYKEALREKNRRRFSRKNINGYVEELLKKREQLPVTDIEIKDIRDLIRIIYISIYAGNPANIYEVKRSKKRVKMGEYTLPYFDIVKKA